MHDPRFRRYAVVVEDEEHVVAGGRDLGVAWRAHGEPGSITHGSNLSHVELNRALIHVERVRHRTQADQYDLAGWTRPAQVERELAAELQLGRSRFDTR